MKKLFAIVVLYFFVSTPLTAQYNLVQTNPYFLTDISGWNFSGDVSTSHIATGVLTSGAAQVIVNSTTGGINKAQMYSSKQSIPDSLRGKMLFFTVFAKGADSMRLRIRIQVFHGNGGNTITKSSYLTLDTIFQKFSIPVDTHEDDVSFKIILQFGEKTGTYVFDDFSMLNADVDFQEINQFDNWVPRNFRRPDSIVSQILNSGTADITLTINPEDTIAKVLPTQFGVNSNMRSRDNLVNRSHLYEEFGSFRYPAGSGSNIYFWDGNKPDTIAINTNTYSGYYWKFLDPDHFLTFRTNAQGEPTIVVNYFYARYGITDEGTREARVQQAADYAAAWVDYYNVQHNANIKYWEIGNECYGSWEKGYNVNGSIVTGKEYGEDLCVFSQAMKAVDTSIRIGAVLSRNGYEWNNQVMREVGNDADYLIVHHYFWVHNTVNAASAMDNIRLDIKAVQAAATMNTDKPKGYFPVCMTEFNLWGDETSNMMNGLFVADALGTMIESNYDLSTIWVNEWTIDENDTHGILSKSDPKQADYTARPSYTPYYYYGKCFGDRLVNDSLSAGGDSLKAYSSVFSSGEIGITILNYSGSVQNFSFQIEDNSLVDSLFWYTVSATDLEIGNRKFYVNGLTSTTEGGGPVDLNSVFAYSAKYSDSSLFTIPPYSVTYAVLKRKTPWTGNSSTDWNTPSNWATGKAPVELTNLSIPASPEGGNFPETNASETGICKDLSIENGAHLYIPENTQLSVSGSLHNNSDENGLILKANSSGTASLLHNNNNVAATVESYLSQDQWHHISAPINNALAGIFTDLYLQEFDETDYSWHYISNDQQDLPEGCGFFAWSASSSTGDATIEYAGILNNGDLTVNGLSYTASQPNDQRGWNMLGNPYPSFINWNSNWTLNNVDATAYIYDGANYLTWNGSTGTHPNGDIAPGQGFWVKVNASGASVTIPQSERKHSTQQFYKNNAENQILMTLTGNGLEDKAMIILNDKATVDFDNQYDAWKIKGDLQAPQLYSIFGDAGMTVNALPMQKDMIIPLGVEVGVTGTYTLGFNDFEINSKLYLEDLLNGKTYKITPGFEYHFAANSGDEVHRFNLYFGNALRITTEKSEDINVYSVGDKIFIVSDQSIDGRVQILDLLGKEIYRSNLQQQFSYTIKLPKQGIYIVKIVNKDKVFTTKIHINNDNK